MHPKCYKESASLFVKGDVVCPLQMNCTELVLSEGYSSTVQNLGPSVVAILSCTLSILGTLLILYTYIRWKDLRTGSRSIITFLSIADLATAIGYVIGSVNYIYFFGEKENTQPCNVYNTVCQIQSFVTTTSSLCSFAWTTILAAYLYMVIVKNKIRLANKLMPFYHVVAWLLPFVITLPLLIKDKLGYTPYAASNWCFIKHTLPNDDWKYACGRFNYEMACLVLLGGKAWEILTYLIVIVLYAAMKWHLYKETKRSGYLQFIGSSTVSAVQRADKKFTFIPVVFILLRIWGTLQFFYATGLAHVTYYGCVPQKYGLGFTILAYIQSVGDGGQGWGNVLLYIISSPKIRQRLLHDLCHPRLRCRAHQQPISKCGSHENVSEHDEITETVN